MDVQSALAFSDKILFAITEELWDEDEIYCSNIYDYYGSGIETCS